MKLNSWQWVGLICLVLGVVGYMYFREQGRTEPAAVQPNPAFDDEAPATQPAGE